MGVSVGEGESEGGMEGGRAYGQGHRGVTCVVLEQEGHICGQQLDDSAGRVLVGLGRGGTQFQGGGVSPDVALELQCKCVRARACARVRVRVCWGVGGGGGELLESNHYGPVAP